ncbi:MAG: hypothetical protein ACE5HE_00910 [Phycisphaerae bacterium]
MKSCDALYRFLPIIVGILSACGCSSRGLWVTGDRASRSPHELGDASADRTRDAPIGLSQSRDERTDVVNLAFDLLRVELPVESVRHSRKVWNHVDELRIESSLAARLARNGVRMGVTSSDSWPAIATILTSCGGVTQREQLLAQAPLPLVFEMGAIESSESIFSYDRNGRLGGRTFTAGKKLVRVGYNVRPEPGGHIDLTVSLEVRHELGVMTWERRGGIIRQVPAFDGYTFDDISVLLPLNAGEALVIGPGGRADNEYLLGSRFFMRRGSDRPRELLLILTPLPYRTVAAGAAAVSTLGDD